jgi:glycine oxidase
MNPDVVIVGGGVIGLATALEASRAGLKVAVLERGALGGGATQAAAGILAPTEAFEWEGVLGAYNDAAITYWASWSQDLKDQSGQASGYEPRVEIRLASGFDESFLAACEAGLQRHSLEVSRLEGAALAAEVPFAQTTGLVALRSQRAAVDPCVLVESLTAALSVVGADITHDEAVSLDTSRGGATVLLRSGDVINASVVVLATGAWGTSQLAGAGLTIPVRPVAGDAIVVTCPELPRSTMLRTERGSVVPRQDGTWWLGTSLRDEGFATGTPLAQVAAIADRAGSLIPALRGAAVIRTTTGLRPVSGDGLPIVGPLSPSLVIATGHGREGITHAPHTAHAIARGLTSEDWDAVPQPFRAARFQR